MNLEPTAHLLLVDDDTVFTATLSRSLQRKNCAITVANNSAGALALLQNQQFDLILLDLNLAGESGLQLLQHILLRESNARVVILTAYASVATAVDAIKRGAENYLCKPVTTNDILNLLAEGAHEESIATINEYPLSVDRLEWEHLQRVLMENGGNISATARALNMHRRTLQRKLQKRPVTK